MKPETQAFLKTIHSLKNKLLAVEGFSGRYSGSVNLVATTACYCFSLAGVKHARSRTAANTLIAWPPHMAMMMDICMVDIRPTGEKIAMSRLRLRRYFLILSLSVPCFLPYMRASVFHRLKISPPTFRFLVQKKSFSF